MKRLFLLFILSFLTTACSNTKVTSLRHVKDYGQTADSYQKVVILPSEVIMHTSDVSNKKERVDNYEYFLEDIVNQEAVKIFDKLNYSASFLSKKQMHNLGVSRFFSHLRDEYSDHKNRLYNELLKDKKLALDIGIKSLPSLHKIREKFPADAYVLIDYEGVIKSSGARTMDFVTAVMVGGGSAPAEKYVLILAIIDGRSGNLLWADAQQAERGAISFDFFNSKKEIEEEAVNKMLTEALKKFKQDSSILPTKKTSNEQAEEIVDAVKAGT